MNSIAPQMADTLAARIDLAAAFRWFARLNMHESVANHMSVAVSGDGLPIPHQSARSSFRPDHGRRSAAAGRE